jgi:transcriptional regulator NrdR family protein
MMNLVGCNVCGNHATKVVFTSQVIRNDVYYTRRKRQCPICKASYRTQEVLEEDFQRWNQAETSANG